MKMETLFIIAMHVQVLNIPWHWNIELPFKWEQAINKSVAVTLRTVFT